ncbi:MAG: VWA-like domain-containing protein [Pseudomonadota bacterium]
MTEQVAAHSSRAASALRALAEADPAIAALSLWCVHRDGPATRTAGEVITYGPDFEALPPHEQRGLAAHHVLHVALRHSARLNDLERRLGAGFDADLYNLAADAVVNEVLLTADHALPRPAVTLTELLEKALGQEIQAELALAEWDAERLYFALMGRDGGDGKQEEAARAYAEAQAFQADVEAESGTQDASEAARQAARWRQHVTRALDAGRAAGRGIGRIGHRLADVPAAQVPWEMLLRRLLTAATIRAAQPDARRPARRWIASTAEAAQRSMPQPGFQPGIRPLTDVPRIAVGLDASSSIDDARLALFWSEVTSIARRMRAELHLYVFDDEIRHAARLDPAQSQFNLPELPRGGGTAFVPVIQAAAQLPADALVMLTDLDGEAGPRPRGLKVFWAVPDAGLREAPFGKLIDMGA